MFSKKKANTGNVINLRTLTRNQKQGIAIQNRFKAVLVSYTLFSVVVLTTYCGKEGAKIPYLFF